MKKNCFIISLLFLFLSCNQTDKNSEAGNAVSPRLKRQILGITAGYARDKFTNPKKSVDVDGNINIGNNRIKYVLDPKRIVTGLIDDDSNEDAIVSISSYDGQNLLITEHLIMIKTGRKLKIARVLEGDMKFLKIKDRIIYAEIPKLAPDSPNYDCKICREVVKYRYKNSELIKTE